MRTRNGSWRHIIATSGFLLLAGAALALFTVATGTAKASSWKSWLWWQRCDSHPCDHQGNPTCGTELTGEPGGTWHWMRSPEEERRVIISLYSRYCIRCHGVDGRGVWDIPDVPDFTNGRWQACRSDGMLARAILEGRGACMPPFRGTLTLEEAWGMARYLRTFLPGTESPRPDVGTPEKPAASPPAPMPMNPPEPGK
jgi:hypothetical protein